VAPITGRVHKAHDRNHTSANTSHRREPLSNETRTLAEFSSSLEFSEIPDEVARRLCWLTVDSIAAGALGSGKPWFAIVESSIGALGGNQECHVFGTAARFDRSRAALLNGVAIGGFEAAHGSTNAQQSAGVFPAVLALAEHGHVAGTDFLRALTIGYEVNARVAAAQTNLAELERGFHNPPISAIFGAAAGCAALLGLPTDDVQSALGIAGSQSAGLIEFVWRGEMTKRVHLGRAASLGLEAALLAAGGLTGPGTVLEGRYGFLQAHSPKPRPDRLIDGLGTDWSIPGIFVKPHPAHGSTLPIVEAIERWRGGSNGTRRVESATVRVGADGIEPRHLEVAPATVMAAQYSVPFTTALALLYGAKGVRHLDHAMLTDPSVGELSQTIIVEQDARFGEKTMKGGAEIAVRIDGGEITLRADGLGPLPLSGLEAACRLNLETYGGDHAYTPEHRHQIVALASQLATLDDVALLAAAITPDIP
jgi:2-methylcitrate dehydratase PrpD